jgi:hypothetical protein
VSQTSRSNATDAVVSNSHPGEFHIAAARSAARNATVQNFLFTFPPPFA